jgi:hypothetical protein
MNLLQKIRPLIIGVLIGFVLSYLPLELAILLGIALFIAYAINWFRRAKVHKRRRYVVGAIAALATTFLAASLPVKQLDGMVGPMHYKTMTLFELTQALGQDWSVMVTPDSDDNRVINGFETTERLTRRAVLEKLARETGMELHVGYCGTGASLLFGAHPSFTTLRKAQRKN